PFYLSRLLDCFTLQVQRKGFCDIFPGKNIIFPLSCAAAFLDFDSVMTPEELFTLALGLGDQWHVSRCVFEGEPKRLELELKHVSGKQFECPQCRCDLVAKVPRTGTGKSSYASSVSRRCREPSTNSRTGDIQTAFRKRA